MGSLALPSSLDGRVSIKAAHHIMSAEEKECLYKLLDDGAYAHNVIGHDVLANCIRE